MAPGVTVTNSPKQKDELILEGNNIEDVSRSGKDSVRAYTATTVVGLKSLFVCRSLCCKFIGLCIDELLHCAQSMTTSVLGPVC